MSPNPRLALSAHVGGAMSGLFLAVLGAVWSQVALGPKALRAAWWCNALGMWVSSAGLVLAAALNTRESTPLAGAVVAAERWREVASTVALSGGGALVLAGLALVSFGLRGSAPR